MKGLLAIGALVGAVAFSGYAQAGCTEGSKDYSFQVGYDSDGKAITEVRTCVGGTFMNETEKAAYWAAQKAQGGCTEGSVDHAFTVGYDSDGRAITEARTCRGGTFMNPSEKAAYWAAVKATKKGCVNGETKTVENYFGSDLYKEYLKCVGGRYVVVGKKLIKQGN